MVAPELDALTRANVARHMGVAIDHFNHDRLEPAREIFIGITESFPDYSGAPQALAALALTYYKQGDCAGTRRHYQALLEHYPENGLVAEALYHLGLCAERSAEPATALEYFSRLLVQYPDTVYARQAQERIDQ